MKLTAEIIVISSLLAFCSTSLANELLVPNQYLTIQSAVDFAVDGDTVIVAPGTYTDLGNRDIDFLGKAITVRSTDPNDPNIVADTIIDCNGSPSWEPAAIIDYGTEAGPHRGFCFHSGEDTNSIVEGFTIIRAYPSGIYCEQSSPKIKNCIISKNYSGIVCYDSNSVIIGCKINDNTIRGISCSQSSPVITDCNITGTSGYYDFSGGSIYCSGGSPTITNCVISNNSDSGIYCYGSNATITGCTISNNSDSGIYCYDSNATITGCTIPGNSASGISCDHYSSPMITSCTISNNSDSGIHCGYSSYSSPIVTDCTITGNSSEHGGGGIYGCSGPITDGIISGNFANGGGGLRYCNGPITNCTITGNLTEYSGGGLSMCDGPITNCIITRNSSGSSGGAMFDCYGPITNCVIAGNSANRYGGCFFRVSGPIINCTITGNSAVLGYGGFYYVGETRNCIIWGNGPEQIYISSNPPQITYSNVQGGCPGLGNIDADPCFVEPGYWADANDPNIIVEPNDPNAVWIDGDYHLQSEGWSWDTKRSRWTYDDVTSRCIDAGNPGSPLGDELLSVPDDPDNIWGQNLRIDMGAFGGTAEASIPPYDWALLADLTNDGLVDLEDFAYQAAGWLNSADQQPGDLNRDSFVDISDLALLVEDWLEQTTWHE